LPLLETWVYSWVGAADASLVKPLFPLFYSALLLGFHGALRARLGAATALVATAALALIPRLADYAGTGLADVPMAAFLVGAAATYAAYKDGGDRRSLAAAGVLLGLAVLTKRDALPYLGAAVLAVAWMERRQAPSAWFAVPSIALCAPWYLYVRLSAVPDRDFLAATPAHLAAHLDRLAPIARLFSLNLLATNEWNVLWYVAAATLLLAIRRKTVRAPALLLLVGIPLAAFVGSLCLSAWPDYTLHVRTSLDRLILGTVPFALWFICEQLAPRERTNS
jgi:4-amino-4-deoxy-L-arabinose transferase-like glycosyltransferase